MRASRAGVVSTSAGVPAVGTAFSDLEDAADTAREKLATDDERSGGSRTLGNVQISDIYLHLVFDRTRRIKLLARQYPTPAAFQIRFLRA